MVKRSCIVRIGNFFTKYDKKFWRIEWKSQDILQVS